MNSLIQDIEQLKIQKRAIILAHFYQPPEIQDIADYVGDSLGLAQQAAATNAEMIVFCGVLFMAETAHILSPNKKVLLPDMDAGCPMARMVNSEQILHVKALYPEATIVSYVNSTAEVKAVSDVCCTSSNAVDVIRRINSNTVLFFPDKNLAAWVAKQVPEKTIIPWNGFCATHEKIREKDVIAAMKRHPNVPFIAHPECNENVLNYASFVGSTRQLIDYVITDNHEEFIIGTECGIQHPIYQQAPQKKIFLIDRYQQICVNMKKITREKIKMQLETEQNLITVPTEIRQKAFMAISRMLNMEWI